MSRLEDELRTPLLQDYRAPQPPRRASSRTWVIIMIVFVQVFLCGLICAFAGVMIVKKIIPLPDKLASWTYKNPSETNMLVTVVSTALALLGSFLLGLSVRHALSFRLSRGVRLSMVTAWLRLAKNTIFFRPRRHLWWTLLSILWVTVIHFLIAAWSNLLTPHMVVQQFGVAGRELDFLNPAVSDFIHNFARLPPIYPTAQSYSLTPQSTGNMLVSPNFISEAGRAAALASVDTKIKIPAFVTFFDYSFNSSTGGVFSQFSYNSSSSLEFPALDEKFQGLYLTYTLMQQGYTANVSCTTSSSPSITLSNTASVDKTFRTPSGLLVNQTMQTWSWTTNCSGLADYYTGEVDIMTGPGTSDQAFTGLGLFATSVCFYQDFSGPSTQSFLVLMQSEKNSTYKDPYTAAPDSIICQVTPLVTVAEVQYSDGKIINANNVQQRALLSDDSWPLLLFPGFTIWEAYLLAQGPYTNTMADDAIFAMTAYDDTTTERRDILKHVLEHYLRGIVEYLGTLMRVSASDALTNVNEALSENMTVPLSGTMNVHTMGWSFHPRTHVVALAIITLVTIVTAASGIVALIEATRRKRTRHSRHHVVFNPTDLIEVLLASSSGSLANALLQCEAHEDREDLRVELVMSDEGQPELHGTFNNRGGLDET